ncbi:hypothetical protein ACFU5Y_28910 [Streptomyces gardneri]|uniref:hypothetical protein n=1 Tax=Streptomyces gardneri TaxID=66892 RepID=UPI0036C6421C
MYGAPSMRAYAELAATHRGWPVDEIVQLLRRAADVARLGVSGADLIEQAQAISSGSRQELRFRVTSS